LDQSIFFFYFTDDFSAPIVGFHKSTKDNPMPTAPFLIGSASGFSGDRTDAAGPVVDTLIARGGPAALMYETLAERTLALAQLEREHHPQGGFDPQLDDLVGPVIERCLRHDIAIIGNFGAANPPGAAQRLHELASAQGIQDPRIAIVQGDDLSGPGYRDLLRECIGPQFDDLDVVSANAYLGAEAIADALRGGAQIVVAGRVADPSLAVGPAMAHFGWAADDWERLGRATMAGHLLECGTQVTGGYFADPGFKDVPDLHAVGFPIAEIDADGGCVIGKADATGGCVDPRTVKEQLLYEVHDPARYLTPDVVADISQAQVVDLGNHRVALSGVTGHARPDRLKVNVCYRGGWLAEAEISYAGPRAEARARLAADVILQRLGPDLPVRIDLIGAVSILGDDRGDMLRGAPIGTARDVRLRVACSQHDKRQAQRIVREVTALYTNGPAGGGGVRTTLKPRLNLISCFVPRAAVRSGWRMLTPGSTA
jgi:hypothetical protein